MQDHEQNLTFIISSLSSLWFWVKIWSGGRGGEVFVYLRYNRFFEFYFQPKSERFMLLLFFFLISRGGSCCSAAGLLIFVIFFRIAGTNEVDFQISDHRSRRRAESASVTFYVFLIDCETRLPLISVRSTSGKFKPLHFVFHRRIFV